MREEKLRSLGVAPEAARASAHARFGDPADVRSAVLDYNATTQRYEYFSIDTRAPQARAYRLDIVPLRVWRRCRRRRPNSSEA